MTLVQKSAGEELAAAEWNELLTAFEERNQKSLTFGGAIDGSSTPQAIAFKDVSISDKISQTSTSSGISSLNDTNDRAGQSFNTSALIDKVTSISVYFSALATAYDLMTLEIYAEDGSNHPTGSPIASKSLTLAQSVVGWNEFVFDEPVALSASTKYVFTVKLTGTISGTNSITGVSNADTSAICIISSNGGTSWTDLSGYDLSFKIRGYKSSADNGKVFKAINDAGTTSGFIGFTSENKSADESGKVKIAGVQDGFFGLVEGAMYRVSSNTAGAIEICSDSIKGDYNVWNVGRAVSNTEITVSPTYFET